MTETYFRQCELSRGTGRTVGYIEERGAFKGALVELTADANNLWTVESVGDHRVTKAELNFMHQSNKHASIA